MEYFNLATNEIEKSEKIIIRPGKKEDVKGKTDVKIPLYAISHGNGTSFAYSNMSLIYKLITNLRGLGKLLEPDIKIKCKEKLYPDEDPWFISKTIIESHNEKIAQHCIEIEKNPNPFTRNFITSTITYNQAEEIVAQNSS